MQLEDRALIAQVLAQSKGSSTGSGFADNTKDQRQAFAQLVRRYQGLVLSVIFSLVRNEESARDLTQETFLKAFRALKSFDQNRSFKPWLLRIANNCALDYLRTRQNKEEVSLDLIMEEEPGLEPFDKNDPSELAEHNLFIEKLSLALHLLPLRYRQAFVLRHQYDLTYDEIAEVMQESENNVRTLLFRARDRLRKLLLENPAKNKMEKNHE